MNQTLVDKIACAVLYEGYILYPYRPSVKNRQRWTFGGLFPQAYSEAQQGSDAWTMQTQCLVSGRGENSPAMLDVKLRFLHLQTRTVRELETPLAELPQDAAPAYRPVESLHVDGKQYQTWQEAVEREIPVNHLKLSELVDRPRRQPFTLEPHRETAPLEEADGSIVGLVVRERELIDAEVELCAQPAGEQLYKLSVRIRNRTSLENVQRMSRDEAMTRSLASTHIVLSVRGAQFISLMDPPAGYKDAAQGCSQSGLWPVLVGEGGETDTMLCSPIILYDYPQIAPESPGDLFDGTEIDEMLSLRIMTLTDQEKQEMAAVDDRAHELLQRTQSLAREQLMGLHGTMKREAGSDGHNSHGPSTAWDSWPQSWSAWEAQRGAQSVRVSDVELKPGDRVRLRPKGRADVFDVALEGMAATITDIEQDYEQRIHIAVTIDDDPGKDFGEQGKIGHRFFFGADEVEPIEDEIRSSNFEM